MATVIEAHLERLRAVVADILRACRAEERVATLDAMVHRVEAQMPDAFETRDDLLYAFNAVLTSADEAFGVEGDLDFQNFLGQAHALVVHEAEQARYRAAADRGEATEP